MDAYELIESREPNGQPQLWSTPDRTRWFACWSQQSNGRLYFHFTDDETEARDWYSRTSKSGFGSFVLDNTTQTESSVTMLLVSAYDWLAIALTATEQRFGVYDTEQEALGALNV